MYFHNSRQIELPSDASDLFKKLRIYSENKLLIKKNMFDAFTWAQPTTDKDDLDKEFERNLNNFRQESIYAYHTHGGYYGFFKPSLDEVIKIGQDIIRTHDVVFVDTVTCDCYGEPSMDIVECYDSNLDMHLGRTTFMYK
jgi:hypothetical protein